MHCVILLKQLLRSRCVLDNSCFVLFESADAGLRLQPALELSMEAAPRGEGGWDFVYVAWQWRQFSIGKLGRVDWLHFVCL